jgi:molybdopterin synthase catalytic subunit
MTDWIALTPHPLSTADAVAFVTDGAAGGIAVFMGTTRAETSPDGRQLLALDYDAYAEMAIEHLRRLVATARANGEVTKVALLHRLGRVAIGEPSVVIAVSTPHRAAAFDACRFLIDQLKADVPIWKQERWDDGTGTWVHPGVKM